MTSPISSKMDGLKDLVKMMKCFRIADLMSLLSITTLYIKKENYGRRKDFLHLALRVLRRKDKKQACPTTYRKKIKDIYNNLPKHRKRTKPARIIGKCEPLLLGVDHRYRILPLKPMKDIKFRQLPYLVKSIKELVPPSLIEVDISSCNKIVQGNIHFILNAVDFNTLANHGGHNPYYIKLYLRFRLFDREGEILDDQLPERLTVRLNSSPVNLKKDPIYSSVNGIMPINLGCRSFYSGRNVLSIKWVHGTRFACMVQLVKLKVPTTNALGRARQALGSDIPAVYRPHGSNINQQTQQYQALRDAFYSIVLLNKESYIPKNCIDWNGCSSFVVCREIGNRLLEFTSPNPNEIVYQNIFLELTAEDLNKLAAEGNKEHSIPLHRIYLKYRWSQIKRSCKEHNVPSDFTTSINDELVCPRKHNCSCGRDAEPTDVTSFINFTPNARNVLRFSSIVTNREFRFMLYLVKWEEPKVLLDRVMSNPEESICRAISRVDEVLKSKGEEDSAAASLKVSALCPISKLRMNYPARGQNCIHMQCFDGLSYISMNVLKCRWICPICSKIVGLHNMFIDKHQLNIIQNIEPSASQFYLLSEKGEWKLWNEDPRGTPNVNENTGSEIGVPEPPSFNRDGVEFEFIDLT